MTEAPRPHEETGDDELMEQLVLGRHEALQLLHHRYAPLIFHVACKTLDAPAAEDITQEVFLSIWRNAPSFDPRKGSFRTWALQIAHHGVINELRRRGRRPRADGDSGTSLVDLSAHDPGPDEQVWNEYRRSAIHRALAALPRQQRQALGLAFFQDLTHEEVADFLKVPLGTAKSRIRVGLQKLNTRLSALVAMLVLGVGLASTYAVRQLRALKKDERALGMLTGSHMEALRMEPHTISGDPEKGIHATYRSERGSRIAVITLSNFPALEADQTYRVWSRSGGVWRTLGSLEPDADGKTHGHARLVVEQENLPWPEALMVTLEKQGGIPLSSSDKVLVVWPSVALPTPK